MKIRTEKVIDVSEWDKLVKKTYRRPYSFQQQDRCQGSGRFHLTVPGDADGCDFKKDTVKEKVNGPERGVSFAAWLKRNPKAQLANEPESRQDQWMIDLWWDRNFYPNIQMVANDIHAKGLLEAGNYTIDID